MKIHSHNPVPAAKSIQSIQPPTRRNDAKGEAREVAFGTGVPSAGGEPSAKPAGSARLDAYAKKVEKRFEHALASNNLSPRQQQALEKERDRFHSMLARFESAYIDSPDAAKMDKGEGMRKLLESFGNSVSHILSGGESSVPSDAPTSIDATTQGGSSRRGIDTIG